MRNHNHGVYERPGNPNDNDTDTDEEIEELMRGTSLNHADSESKFHGHQLVSMKTSLRRLLIALIIILSMLAFFFFGQPFLVQESLSTSNFEKFKVATWNIAAVNNNPFEYWLEYPEPSYKKLMKSVQNFIESPGGLDVTVSEVFTDDMFNDLVKHMKKNSNYELKDIKQVTKLWKEDYSNRKIISGFMKDKKIGLKRLVSMPDRVTNTIALEGGEFAYRPTVINCYSGSLDSVPIWWKKWVSFMFYETIHTVSKEQQIPASMLNIIPRAKYSALSELEETVSIPLQTLICAIFDSIMVHMMTSVDQADGSSWQTLRTHICDNLNHGKTAKVITILENTYASMDLICLQEVSASMFDKLISSHVLSNTYHLVKPNRLSRSDQNSVLLLSKKKFPGGMLEDLTSKVVVKESRMVAPGDLLVVSARDAMGRNFILASFHGDTNGLATIPVTTALSPLVVNKGKPESFLVFGLDANTYETGVPGKTQDVTEYASFLKNLGWTSVRGDKPKANDYTTYNARTFLQPQLNKASRLDEIQAKGDVNPKDFVVFLPSKMKLDGAWAKDNTGIRKYKENSVFPTLSFPSDHGIMSATLSILNEEN